MSGMRARSLIPTGSKISQRKNLFFILQRYVSVETCSNGLSISDSLARLLDDIERTDRLVIFCLQ